MWFWVEVTVTLKNSTVATLTPTLAVLESTVVEYAIFYRSYCYTVGSANGIIMSSVCVSVCNAVHCGAQGRCRELKFVQSCH